MSNAPPGGYLQTMRLDTGAGPALTGLGATPSSAKGFIPPSPPRLYVDPNWALTAKRNARARNLGGENSASYETTVSGLEAHVVIDGHAQRRRPGLVATTLWVVPALALHLGLIGLAALAIRDHVALLTGAGGALPEAISVDIVTSDILDSLSAKEIKAASASAGNVTPVAAAAPPPVAVQSNESPVTVTDAKDAITDVKTETQQESASSAPNVVATETSAEIQAIEPPVEKAPDEKPPEPKKPEEKKPDEDAAKPITAATAEPAPAAAAAAADARSSQEKAIDEAGAAAASAGIRDAYKALVGKTLADQRAHTTFKFRKAAGTVKISFSIAADGRIEAADVVSSSGHSYLDNQALAMVRGTVFPKPPPAVAENQKFTSTITFK